MRVCACLCVSVRARLCLCSHARVRPCVCPVPVCACLCLWLYLCLVFACSCVCDTHACVLTCTRQCMVTSRSLQGLVAGDSITAIAGTRLVNGDTVATAIDLLKSAQYEVEILVVPMGSGSSSSLGAGAGKYKDVVSRLSAGSYEYAALGCIGVPPPSPLLLLNSATSTAQRHHLHTDLP